MIPFALTGDPEKMTVMKALVGHLPVTNQQNWLFSMSGEHLAGLGLPSAW